MPNAKVLKQKQDLVAKLQEQMKNAVSGVLVSYKGINVADDTKLRTELRESNVDYAVVKNTMLRFAAKEIGFEALDEHLHGTTALATSMDDVVAPARILNSFAKKNPNFILKAGFLEGGLIDAGKLAELANLPDKNTLIAQVLYGFNTPITKLALAIQAIADKQAEGGEKATAATEDVVEEPAEVAVEATVATEDVAEELAEVAVEAAEAAE